jgi:hypothetical protein
MDESNIFKLRFVSYNCKHFIQEGPKFDFINSLCENFEFIFLQEHWLLPSQLGYLAKIGDGFCVEAKSSMNECIERKGRPHGGCAIIWNPTIYGTITSIACTSVRLCGVLYQVNNNSMLILNAYMPCDKGYDDGSSLQEYCAILMEVRLLME